MNKFISFALICSLVSNLGFAECDFSKGITPLPNGNYEYSKDCHIRVGQLVQENATKDQQISDYIKAISLKDLAIKESDNRAQLWLTTSSDLENRIQKLDSMQRTNEFLYFGAGVLASVLIGFATARLVGK